MLAALALTLFIACEEATKDDPLARIDARYAEITKNLAVADRDTTRNRTNKEARRLKVNHEQERVAFFNDPDVVTAIEAARASSDPAAVAKGEAYWRHAVYVRSWTEPEKALETELLARIEATRNQEASWTSPDGQLELSITGRWDTVSADADALGPVARQDFADAWLENRMTWLDDDLTRLLRLRNEVARREGFDNYWELSLYHRGLDPEAVEDFLDEVETLVTPLNTQAQARVSRAAKAEGLRDTFANAQLLRRRAGLELRDPEADSWFDTDLSEETVSRMLRDLGFDTAGIQVYTGPSRYTRRGAYSFAIQPPDYLAVVISVDHRQNMWNYRAMAHEVGRALWWRNLPPSLLPSPVLWEPAPAYLEGFGQFFERMLFEPGFAENYVPELPEGVRARMREARIHNTVSRLTWYLGSTRVERMLYEQPGAWAAITSKAAAMDKKIRARPWGSPVDSRGYAWSSFLESGIMLNYAGYVQNFLYEYAVEAALFDAATKAVGPPVGNNKVAEWLIGELIHQVGPETTFEERLSALSGGEPPTAALRRYLGSAGEGAGKAPAGKAGKGKAPAGKAGKGKAGKGG